MLCAGQGPPPPAQWQSCKALPSVHGACASDSMTRSLIRVFEFIQREATDWASPSHGTLGRDRAL